MSEVLRKIVKGKRTERYYLVCCGKKTPIYGTGRDDALDWDDEEVTARCPVCYFETSWGLFRDGSTEKIRLTAEEKVKRYPSPEERAAEKKKWDAEHPATGAHYRECEQCSRTTISVMCSAMYVPPVPIRPKCHHGADPGYCFKCVEDHE